MRCRQLLEPCAAAPVPMAVRRGPGAGASRCAAAVLAPPSAATSFQFIFLPNCRLWLPLTTMMFVTYSMRVWPGISSAEALQKSGLMAMLAGCTLLLWCAAARRARGRSLGSRGRSTPPC